MGGNEYEVTESEYKTLLGAPGLIFLPRIGVTINANSITSIEPANLIKTAQVDREAQKIGVAPNGEIIEKRYGIWYVQKPTNEYQYDENGQSLLRYTEMTMLPTPSEYEAIFKELPTEQWTEMLIGKSEMGTLRIESKRSSTNGLTKIGSVSVPEIQKEQKPEWCDVHSCFAIDCREYHQDLSE